MVVRAGRAAAGADIRCEAENFAPELPAGRRQESAVGNPGMPAVRLVTALRDGSRRSRVAVWRTSCAPMVETRSYTGTSPAISGTPRIRQLFQGRHRLPRTDAPRPPVADGHPISRNAVRRCRAGCGAQRATPWYWADDGLPPYEAQPPARPRDSAWRQSREPARRQRPRCRRDRCEPPVGLHGRLPKERAQDRHLLACRGGRNEQSRRELWEDSN